MAFIETDALVKVRDIEGREYLIYPVTKAENVQGLDTFIGNILDTSGSEIAQGIGVKFDPEKDKLMMYNPYSDQWVESDVTTGKIIVPSTITVTTTTLGGQAVTCTIGEESYTTTFVVTEGTSGVAVFTVYSDGVATITCGESHIEITIAEKGGQTINTNLEERVVVMLLENGRLQNGATWQSNNINYWLIYKSEAGAFKNKYIHFKNLSGYRELCAEISVDYNYNYNGKNVNTNGSSYKNGFNINMLIPVNNNEECIFSLQKCCEAFSGEPTSSEKIVSIDFRLIKSQYENHTIVNDTIWLE